MSNRYRPTHHLSILFVPLVIGAVLLLSSAPTLAQPPTPRPTWDGASRFTILVMGMDRRPGARDTLSVRADAIMLVSLDPASSSIGILHIPRDLMFIPRWRQDYVRANTLLVEGETLGTGRGPEFAIETLWFNLGIRIHSYAIVDFTAFVSLINAIGGIDVYVPYTIDDPKFPDMNYGYDPLHIPAGSNHFDGQTALKYIRTRHVDSDFERGERQMQIIRAIRERLLDGGVMPGLAASAPRMLDELDGNIYTDLTMNEILRLGLFAMSVPEDNIHTGGIDRDSSEMLQYEDGSEIMVLRGSRLYALMESVFGPTYAG